MSHDERHWDCFRLFVHDLNNPLTAVRMLSDMLLDSDLGVDAREDVQDILQAADLSVVLSDGLSRFAKSEQGPPSLAWAPIDLRRTVSSTVDRPAFRRTVNVQGVTTLPLSGDGEALGHALTDILANGRRLVGEQPLEIRLSKEASHALISVRHPGLVLTPDLASKLAIPYGAVELRAQAVSASAGGLVRAHQIIEAHNGSLTWDCTPTHTDALVRLPT